MARRVTTKLRKALEKVQMERDWIEMTAIDKLLARAGKPRRGGRTRAKTRPRKRRTGFKR